MRRSVDMLLKMIDFDNDNNILEVKKASAVPRRSSKLMIQGEQWKVADETWHYGANQEANPIVVLRLKRV